MNILHSNKVLITGATGGLGHSLSRFFVEKGHPLIITSKSIEKLQILKKNLNNIDGDIEYFKCDLLNQKEFMDLVAFSEINNVKVLVNNAAITCPGKKLSSLTMNEINAMLSVNLQAPINLMRLLEPCLTDIININSIVGLEHKKYRSIYSASKWGLRGFSESYKKEISNLSILDVYPSNIRTWPERENAMDIIEVVSKIYNSFHKKDSRLIIDGRDKI